MVFSHALFFTDSGIGQYRLITFFEEAPLKRPELTSKLNLLPSPILIDKLLQVEDGYLVAIKNVSRSEPWFANAGHTSQPFPSAMLIEAMAQAGTLLLSQNSAWEGYQVYFTQADNVRFLGHAFPGDQLRLEIELRNTSGEHANLIGRGLVDGRTICEAQLGFSMTAKPSRPQIHPTASVHPSAQLGKDVVVGPYSIIGENVIIGDRTIIEAHVFIEKWTQIGEDCHIYFGCVIGSQAQDVKYQGEKSWVVIGDRNEIREYVTINRSTGNNTVTQIGSDNILLTSVHIGHNCVLGNRIIMANLVSVGGHTQIGDRVVIGGMAGIHQHLRIGRGAMVGGLSRLNQDVPSFTLCEGNPAYARGLNVVGIKRSGAGMATLKELKTIYKLVFRSEMNLSQALEAIQETKPVSAEAHEMMAFLSAPSTRGIVKKHIDSEEFGDQ